VRVQPKTHPKRLPRIAVVPGKPDANPTSGKACLLQQSQRAVS
ncbi:hypothetical protein TIFTF001_055448, partial [Ficus carica]